MSLEDEIKKLRIEIEKLNNQLSKNDSNKNKLNETLTYTISEFCKKLQISKGTFYKLIKEKSELKIIKIGRRSFISKEEADRWVQDINGK